MLTVAKLKAYGANVEEGVSRCLDSEEFYLELINTVLEDGDPAPLKQALLAKDVNAAFEIAHGLRECTQTCRSRRCSLPRMS